MSIKYLLLGLIAMLTAACNPQEMVERAAPKDDQQLARAAIDDLVAGRSDALAARMPPEVRQNLAAVVPQMRAVLPPDPSVRLVQANWKSTAGGGGSAIRQSNLVYELSGGGRFALAELVIEREGGSAVVAGFHVQPAAGPVDAWSGFSLAGKSSSHYAMLGAAVAALGVTIWALVRIWRSGLFTRRWLWTIGALLGVGKLSFDWATGALSFMPIAVQLFSASAVKPGVGAWQVAVSIPLVAIWALLIHRSNVPARSEV